MSQQRPMWRRVAPSQHLVSYRHGSAHALGRSDSAPAARRVPFGFAPARRESWGEATWTARDLADLG